MTAGMFRLLQTINERPALFSKYTAADLWTDPHRSAQMLAYHLNDDVDLSSRRSEFIDRSVGWIARRFAVGAGTKVADFGCGPGLYAQRLAALGARVTGVDFSAHSLEYAREVARQQNTEIDYVQADYLDFSSPERFDLILLIMCDFGVLSPAQRRRLLSVFRAHLRPGGAVLLDVPSLVSYGERQEEASYAFDHFDGLWAAEPYYAFANTFKYDEEKVVLDKFTLVAESGTREVYNWFQHFDRQSLQTELTDAGFLVEEILADVAGGPWEASSPQLAVVARAPAHPGD